MDATGHQANFVNASRFNAIGPNLSSIPLNSHVYSPQQRVELLRKLKSEAVRLSTFRFWSSQIVQPAELAKAGFFYFNDQDKVQCAFCLGIVGQWEQSDIPMQEHRMHCPRCPFVGNLPVGNIPIGSEQTNLNDLAEFNGAEDLNAVRSVEMRPRAEPERGKL
jgi:hypothetical protein